MSEPEYSGPPRRGVNLAVVSRLFDYALSDPWVTHCREQLTHTAILQSEWRVLVGETEIPYLNNDEFKHALVRSWVETALYLRLIGLAVIRVPKNRSLWLQRFAENVTLGPRLPWDVVSLRQETGILYQTRPRPQDLTPRWVYETKDELERGQYYYYIYMDATTPFVEPILPRHILDVTLDAVTGRLMQQAIDDRGGGFGGMGNPFVLRSGFYSLLRHFLQLYEIEENIMDAEHQATHPIAVFTKRPMKEIAPSLIGHDALEMAGSSRGAAQMETAALERRRWAEGVKWAEENLFPMKFYINPMTGDSETKAGVMRRFFDRSNPHDDALLMTEDVAAVSRAPPVFKVDREAWVNAHLREVALVFHLPISYVESSFIGQTGGSAAGTGRASRTGEKESQGIDEKAETAFSSERQAFARWFGFIYPLSLGGFELVELNAWLERVTAEEQLELGRLLARPKGTKGERRAHLGELLAPPPPRTKARGGRGGRGRREPDESETEEGVSMSAAQLRALIAERLQAREYLPAELHFEVDDTRPEELLTDYDMLPKDVKDDRAARAKILAEASEGAEISGESMRKGLEKLLSVKLAGATKEELDRKIPIKPPPGAPGGKK